MNLQQQLKEAQKLLGEEIKNIQIAVCDLNGIFRGKKIPVEQVEKLQREPIGMAFCSVLDIWGDFVEGNFLVTDVYTKRNFIKF